MHELIKEYEIINKNKNETKTEIDKIEKENNYLNEANLFLVYPLFFGAFIINILFLFIDIGLVGEGKVLLLSFIAIISNPIIYHMCKNTKHKNNIEWYFLSFASGLVIFITVIAFPFFLVKGIIDLWIWTKAGGFKRKKYKSIKESNEKYDSLLKTYKELEEKENSLVMTIKENELALNELQHSSKNKSLLEKISIILEREYSHNDIVAYHIANKQKQYIQND